MNKKKIGLGILILGVTFGAGFFAKPAKVVVQTKEVVKTVTIVQEAKTKIVYRDIVTAPDGTKHETERSEERTDTSSSSAAETVKTAKTATTNDLGLTLSMLAIVDSSDFSGHKDYGIHVTKRILGNLNVGILATTDKKIGVSVGLSF